MNHSNSLKAHNAHKAPKRPNIGYTAAQSILKNELKYIDKWLDYTEGLDFRVLLDTGSDDGSWEYLQKRAKDDSSIIIDQLILQEFRFDIVRDKNHSMVPEEVQWCFAPDLDEYFSVNTLDELEKFLGLYPSMTNMACTRLDIYSPEVFVGPPRHLGSNKIFRFKDYKWKSRIYEHLSYIQPTPQSSEVEIHNPNVYLVHDQDYKKTSTHRNPLYKKLLEQSRDEENSYDFHWTGWFLCNLYFKEQDLYNYIRTAIKWLPVCTEPEKYAQTLQFLKRILEFNPPELSTSLRSDLRSFIEIV